MKKKKEKTVPIQVTAVFTVTFDHEIREEDFKKLNEDEIEIDDVVDDSIAYGHLATEGHCDFEWDYSSKAKKAKKK